MYYGGVERLKKSVTQSIRKHALLKPGNRLGVAVSGGADSVALLRLMLELRGDMGFLLSVVHFNHKLRGTESEDDELFVRNLASAHKLEFFCDSGDVATHAREVGLSLEAAARRLRYEYFRKLLESHALNRIATAHTMNDQAETVLLKLARGAGSRGLAGVYPRLEMPSPVAAGELRPDPACVIRPLLWSKRQDVLEYLAVIKQPWRQDKSNRDLRHARNRVRHGILPRLERHVNSAVVEVLSDAAEIARAEEHYWEDEVSRLLPSMWKPRVREALSESKRDTRACCLDVGLLAELPLASQRRVVRAAAHDLGLGLEFRHVEQLLEIASPLAASRSSVMLPHQWTVFRDKSALRFERTEAPEVISYEYNLAVPGRVEVPEIGRLFESVVVAAATPGKSNVTLLGPKPPGDLLVRNWRAGDRFWPAHRKGPMKIKELLQEQHISGAERQLWPVILSGEQVVWMRGFPSPSRLLTREPAGESVMIRELPLE